MTTHGENMGSRKVEPETHELPKWRLKANYVMRKLARAWYGELPPQVARNYPKSKEFEHAIIDITWHFSEEVGMPGKYMMENLRRAKKKFEDIHGHKLVFEGVSAKLEWIIKTAVPTSRYEEFMQDELIQSILRTAAWIFSYDVEDLDPPYSPEDWLKPLEYYEALPVLEPTPYWRLLANALERELAYVWHDYAPYVPERLFTKLRELFFAFGEYAGVSEGDLLRRIENVKREFWGKHGIEVTFRTPVQEIIWMSEVGMPDYCKGCFAAENQISLILRALELLYILNKAGVTPPYRQYLLNFQDPAFYDKIQLPETE
jgi:hypothetical protein